MSLVPTRLYVAIVNRLAEIRREREHGMTTTEVAVLTFVLVGIALVIGSLLLQYSKGVVTDLPDTPPFDDEPVL